MQHDASAAKILEGCWDWFLDVADWPSTNFFVSLGELPDLIVPGGA